MNKHKDQIQDHDTRSEGHTGGRQCPVPNGETGESLLSSSLSSSSASMGLVLGEGSGGGLAGNRYSDIPQTPARVTIIRGPSVNPRGEVCGRGERAGTTPKPSIEVEVRVRESVRSGRRAASRASFDRIGGGEDERERSRLWKVGVGGVGNWG